MTVYSFDGVLRAKRSMHSIEVAPRRRVPLPRPVPYVNVLYFVGVLAVVAALDNLVPLVSLVGAPLNFVAGGGAGITAWAACYLMVPVGVVWAATNVAVDGRSPHRWAVSVARYERRRKRTILGRPVRRDGTRVAYRGRVKFWWDLQAPRLHHGWVVGGRATLSVSVRFTHAIRHRSQVVRPDGRGHPVSDHEVQGRLEVRP